MTIMRTEVDGVEYSVLHYRFAINNPNAKITMRSDSYFAEIGNITYVLGFSKSDGNPTHIARELNYKIQKEQDG